MLSNLGNWIREFSDNPQSAPCADTEWAQAIAGLLVEAAMVDGELEEGERRQIAALLAQQLELGRDEVAAMIESAIEKQSERIEIHGITKAIREQTEPEDRVAVMEMAWMVVLADGEVHEHEAQLMRRLAGLLYVDDVDSGRAAKLARARLERNSAG